MSLEDIVKQLNDGKLKDEEKLAGFLALTDDIVSIIKASKITILLIRSLYSYIFLQAQDLQGFAEVSTQLYLLLCLILC